MAYALVFYGMLMLFSLGMLFWTDRIIDKNIRKKRFSRSYYTATPEEKEEMVLKLERLSFDPHSRKKERLRLRLSGIYVTALAHIFIVGFCIKHGIKSISHVAVLLTLEWKLFMAKLGF